jgi:hypothetical protein
VTRQAASRWGLLILFSATAAAVLIAYRNSSSTTVSMQTKPAHVVLIGASIGQGWNLAEWPGRVQLRNLTAEAVAVWDFDKADAVKEVLMRPARHFRLGRSFIKALFQPRPKVPDIVILKECSAYFPGDGSQYRRKVAAWVEQLRSRSIMVVLATVVPVTSDRAARDPGKQESLLEYNRWVREYAKNAGLTVLDLEAMLRTAAPEAYLDSRYANADGSHLNPEGYSVLDAHLRSVLCAAAPGVCTAQAGDSTGSSSVSAQRGGS